MTSRHARDLHFGSIVLDTHQDTTQRLARGDFDLAVRHPDGSVDIPRMREGGLGGAFWAIWVPGTVTGEDAVARAFNQIHAVHACIVQHSNDLAFCRTAKEIRQARAMGRIAILLGVEGGHMINGDLGVLRSYFDLGARYLTLTHMRNTEWADSSTDKAAHNGLTDFGKEAIREMNRLGMLVDVSHASDRTFWDTLAVSQTPVIASHSSCRALCGAARNLSDDMIKALAAKGGVIQINFHAGFISSEFRAAEDAHPEIRREIAAEAKRRGGGLDAGELLETEKLVRRYVAAGRLPRAAWSEIIDHIDHAVKIAGADHVGFGSDFDGADMPDGMEDASQLPRITDALCSRGYFDADVQNILGGNALRLMERAEAAAEKRGGTQ